MHQAEKGGCNGRCGPHHPVITTDIYRLIRQVIDYGAVLIKFSLVIRVRKVLIEKLVVFFVVQQVLVNDPLFLIQISGELVSYIDLVVFVLNLTELLQSDTNPLNHIVEFGMINDHIVLLLDFFKCFNDFAKLFIWHCFDNGLDFVSGLEDQVFHL